MEDGTNETHLILYMKRAYAYVAFNQNDRQWVCMALARHETCVLWASGYESDLSAPNDSISQMNQFEYTKR